MCHLDRISGYYRWTATFSVPGYNVKHRIAVSHHDSERAALELTRLLDTIQTLFSKEYGRQ
jgi:hypothetical protein